MNEIEYSKNKFQKALQQLEKAIHSAQDGDELKRDGVIQRFEFTFELMWKTFEVIETKLGKTILSPRHALQEAFRLHLFEEEKIFLRMLEDRNLSSHTYQENLAKEIFERIEKDYLSQFSLVLKNIENLSIEENHL